MQFAQTYWDIFLDVLDNYPNCEIININVRKISLISNTTISLEQRDRLFKKLRGFGQDYKFFLLNNTEYVNSNFHHSQRPTDIIKKINLFTGAEMIDKGKLTSQITNMTQKNLAEILPNDKVFELTPEQLKKLTKDVKVKSHKGTLVKVKKELVFESLDSEMSYRISNYKKSLKASSTTTFFNSYRDILDMDYFEDTRNTFHFWNTYVQQYWSQSSKEEKERMWLHLNSLVHFKSGSSNDFHFTLKTMKEINYPFMITEQINILSQKIDGSLAPIHFLESILEKARSAVPKVEADMLLYSIVENLDELNETDIKYGVAKSFFEDNKEIKDMVSKVQMRKWLDAEELCEGIMEDMGLVDGENDSLKSHIERYFVEECWIEVLKNLNEWQKIYELAINTERRDLLVESAYYMHKPLMMDKLSVECLDSDNPLTYIYYMSIRLIDLKCKDEVIVKDVTKKLKELLYVTLINKCYILPNAFSEKHKNLL